MKPSIATIVATAVVAVAIWLIFYFIIDPGRPLGGAETTVVVGFSGLLVVAARWVARRGKRADHESQR
jgi:hypothetical protein